MLVKSKSSGVPDRRQGHGLLILLNGVIISLIMVDWVVWFEGCLKVAGSAGPRYAIASYELDFVVTNLTLGCIWFVEEKQLQLDLCA